MKIQTFKHGTNSAAVIEAVERDGAVIIEGALSPAEIAQIDQETKVMLGEVDNCDGIFHGYNTKRVGGLVDKSELCQKMVLDQTALDVMDHFLKRHCSDYQLNLTQLISIESGEDAQILHPDEGLFPYSREAGEQSMINVMWAVDDFTVTNGATRVAPGSHRWSRDRAAEPEELTQAEMTKGSYLIYLGGTVHGGGANTSGQPRRGIVLSYCLGWLRQAENQYLAVPLEKAKTLPERLQQLLGYFVHAPNLGAVDGHDPIWLLQDRNERVQFRDFMTPEAQALLDKHHANKDAAAWSDLKLNAA